jgi:hypothetical protein
MSVSVLIASGGPVWGDEAKMLMSLNEVLMQEEKERGCLSIDGPLTAAS